MTTQKPPRTPRWVRAFGIVALVIAALIVAALLLSDGRHGPGMHQRHGLGVFPAQST